MCFVDRLSDELVGLRLGGGNDKVCPERDNSWGKGFRIFFYDTGEFEAMTKKCTNHL